MKNKRHYIVIENEKPNRLGNDKYLIVDEATKERRYCYYSNREEAEAKAEEYNHTYYISDYSRDEVDEFFKSVDFSILEKAINERLGMNLTFNHSYELVRGEYRVKFKANENLCKMPEGKLLSKILVECYIEQFNNTISVIKESGELYIWMTIDFSYNFGSNGCEFCNAVYKNGNWKISFAEDNYYKLYRRRISRRNNYYKLYKRRISRRKCN